MKKKILIPVLLLLLLIIAWFLRWDYKYSQDPDGRQIMYLNDRWLSQSWTETYDASDDYLLNGERKPVINETVLQSRARQIFSGPEAQKKEQYDQDIIQQARSEMDKFAAQALQYSEIAGEEEEAASEANKAPVEEIPSDLQQAYAAYHKASADLISAQSELDSLFQNWAIPLARHQLEQEIVGTSTSITRLWQICTGIVFLWLTMQFWLPYYKSLDQMSDISFDQIDEESLDSSTAKHNQDD